MSDEITQTASWIQTGGVLAFAGAVLWELKQLRPLIKEWIEERRADRDLIGEVKTLLAQLLERERMRSEQRAQLLRRKAESDQPLPEQWEDVTDNVSIPTPVPKRAHTAPFGLPYGPMTPKKGR